MADTLEYPYRAQTRAMLLGMAFFGACAAVMARAGATNDRGLIINGVITLSPERATTFYWGVAMLSVVFVAVAGSALMANRANPRFVRLSGTELSAPKNGFARKHTVIRLGDIRGVTLQEIHRQRMLTIHHAAGSLTIAQSMLPNRAAFDELANTLESRLQRQGTAASGALR